MLSCSPLVWPTYPRFGTYKTRKPGIGSISSGARDRIIVLYYKSVLDNHLFYCAEINLEVDHNQVDEQFGSTRQTTVIFEGNLNHLFGANINLIISKYVGKPKSPILLICNSSTSSSEYNTLFNLFQYFQPKDLINLNS